MIQFRYLTHAERGRIYQQRHRAGLTAAGAAQRLIPVEARNGLPPHRPYRWRGIPGWDPAEAVRRARG